MLSPVCSQNAAIAFNYLVSRGLTPAQAAGVIGNLQQESYLDPRNDAPDPTKTDPSARGRGIAAWGPPRWQNLITFSSGRDPKALDTQLDFLWYELQSQPSLGLQQLLATTTPEDATVVFQNRFENPLAAKAATSTRIKYANDALECLTIEPPPEPPSKTGVVVASVGVVALVGAAGYGVYRVLSTRKPEPPDPPRPDFPPAPPYFPSEKRTPLMKRPAVWITAGGAALSTVLLLTRKRTGVVPATPAAPPPQTYGETTKVTLSVPAGWRRMTSAEVNALPELGAAANALINSPGFTTMQYGSLFPFVASDGNTYATWVEQHYHEPLGPVKPWGLHHGVTLLAQDVGLVGVGYLTPAVDVGQATVYDFLYVWDGRQWQIERAGYVIEADVVDHPDRLDNRPFSDVLNSPAPPYRIVSRYYLAEQQGNRFWQHLGMDRNY